MTQEQITKETIYNFIKEWQYELKESHLKEFEKDVYRRLDYIDRQFDQVNKRIERTENGQTKNSPSIKRLFENQKEQTPNLIVESFFNNILASIIASIQ